MKSLNYLIMSVVGVLVAACATGPYTPKSDALNPETQGSPVVLLDKDLVRTLAVDQNVLARRDSAHRLHIQAPMRNRTNDETLYIQVQTLWRNDAGAVLYSETGSEAAWQSMTLTPNQIATYTQTALTSDATHFTVRVRYQTRHKDD